MKRISISAIDNQIPSNIKLKSTEKEKKKKKKSDNQKW